MLQKTTLTRFKIYDHYNLFIVKLKQASLEKENLFWVVHTNWGMGVLQYLKPIRFLRIVLKSEMNL
jgi:hypothetical protein